MTRSLVFIGLAFKEQEATIIEVKATAAKHDTAIGSSRRRFRHSRQASKNRRCKSTKLAMNLWAESPTSQMVAND